MKLGALPREPVVGNREQQAKTTYCRLPASFFACSLFPELKAES
jgi:hypothetical protein